MDGRKLIKWVPDELVIYDLKLTYDSVSMIISTSHPHWQLQWGCWKTYTCHTSSSCLVCFIL